MIHLIKCVSQHTRVPHAVAGLLLVLNAGLQTLLARLSCDQAHSICHELPMPGAVAVPTAEVSLSCACGQALACLASIAGGWAERASDDPDLALFRQVGACFQTLDHVQ